MGVRGIEATRMWMGLCGSRGSEKGCGVCGSEKPHRETVPGQLPRAVLHELLREHGPRQDLPGSQCYPLLARRIFDAMR
eukprot:1711497-Rhodomonas_salina.1